MSTISSYSEDALMWFISTCTALFILLGSGALYLLIEHMYCKMKRK